MMIDFTSQRHGGAQKMTVKYNNDSDTLSIPLKTVVCMINFRHSLPTSDEITTLNQYC
jgi:hypothetical protein